MDWIFDHLNLVIIIGVVVASFLKSVFDAKTKEADEPVNFPDADESDAPDKSYRKMPPPLTRTVPRPSQPPPLHGNYSEIPGAAAAAADEAAKALKHQLDLAARLQQIRDTKATTTGGAAVTRARIASKGKAKSSKDVPLSLRARLKSPAEVRRAFVMREILDRPVGLR